MITECSTERLLNVVSIEDKPWDKQIFVSKRNLPKFNKNFLTDHKLYLSPNMISCLDGNRKQFLPITLPE